MKWLLRIFLLLLIAGLAGGGWLALEAKKFLETPASNEPREFVFTIPPGATFDKVANELLQEGAISDVLKFKLLARFKESLAKVKAGEYAMNTGWTPEQVLYQITEGKTMLYRMSVREGLTWWDTAKAVDAQGFAKYADFKAVVHDPKFLREHHIPFANAEGFLFPETYMMKKPPEVLDRAQAYAVASLMVNSFWKQTENIWKRLPRKKQGADGAALTGAASVALYKSADLPWAKSKDLPEGEGPQSPADIDPDALNYLIILASLVEKETGVPAERPRVAGVYSNRMRIGMLLQCDPTIIYGVGETFGGVILRSQLNDEKNLYNTYKHPGLPPGPISSSGLSALEAAFAPEQHDYLYFVATGVDAGHVFSKTVNEHNKAVQIYRARMREKEKQR